MTKQLSLFAKEEVELAAHEAEMEEASGMIREKVIVFGRHLAEIHESACWKCRYKSFDDYCQERWKITGARGRQLVDAYGVAKNLASMTDEGGLPTFFYSYFSESHARELKKLPADQQATAWNAAKSQTEKPTAKLVGAIVEEMKAKPETKPETTPDDIYKMGKADQQKTIADIEAKAESAYTDELVLMVLAIAQKRLRAIGEDIKKDRYAAHFRVGEFHIQGGILGLVTVLREELRLAHERLASPLLDGSA